MDHEHIQALGGRGIAVVGDLMLDCYVDGSVTRISPEAPVPVLSVRSRREVAGGAANVVANLAALGAAVRVVGVTGEDGYREDLLSIVRATGDVDCTGVVACPSRKTTHKLRIVCDQQQIVRVDHEDVVPLAPGTQARCIAAALDAAAAADVVIVSDYGKGVCFDELLARLLGEARAAGKVVIVDPKRRDLGAYRGATLLTPNRKELAEATGLPCETDAEAAAAARAAQEMCGAEILLTRSEKGMSYFPLAGEPIHLATVAQDVFDVSGAGDTVVATIATALAAGLPMASAMRLANHAAGVVVSKLGTAVITLDELSASLAAESDHDSFEDGRLLTIEEAVRLRRAWHHEKLTVGFANGCFDLLHPGHVALIRQAADACDRLIVALNTDASVRRLKGASRPIQDERARAAVMGGLRGVAAVILFDEDTPLEAIEALQPDVLVKGSDYTEDTVVGAPIVKARGGRVVLANLIAGQSTSRLVAASAKPPVPEPVG